MQEIEEQKFQKVKSERTDYGKGGESNEAVALIAKDETDQRVVGLVVTHDGRLQDRRISGTRPIKGLMRPAEGKS